MTNLTTPQGNALNKVKSADSIFKVRSVLKESTTEDFTLSNIDNLQIDDFIKVYSDGNGNVISGVNSLK